MEFKKLTADKMEVEKIVTEKVIYDLEQLKTNKESLEGQLKQVNDLIEKFSTAEIIKE